MSLIARCPACATLFRVVPDQLKISDGWVRCGQCSEVFDASVTLQATVPASAQQAAPAAETSPAQASAEATATRETSEPADPAPATAEATEASGTADLALLEGETLAMREAAAASDPAPEPPSAQDLPDPDPREPETLSMAQSLLARPPAPAVNVASQTAPDADTDTDTVAPAEAAPPPWASHGEPVLAPGPLPGDESVQGLSADPALDPPAAPTPQADEALRDMSFVRQARRRAFWEHRRMRMTLAVLAGVLGVSLVGQVVFHHRDRIAAQAPALRPLLAAVCGSFECRLGPPRRIESIAIESSAFTRVRADAFRLSLTLSNQADIALAMPALELTLTDLQDQPVLRRVLQPADLGPQAPQVIEPRAEWTSTLTLAVAPAANPARIVGYRVLAFYP